MKKYALLLLFLFFAVFSVSAQPRRVPIKSTPIKAVPKLPAAFATEIPTKDWETITSALDKEDWTQAAALSSQALSRLKIDNDRKQLAQLRYFYIYAVAGKVAGGKTTFAELEKIANGFVGQEFMMPNRAILADCKDKVNYICAAKDSDQIVRVTATDTAAAIHSFEYVKLSEKFDAPGNNGKSASLTGTLEKVETHSGKLNMKIIRLIFGNGFINLAPNQ